MEIIKLGITKNNSQNIEEVEKIELLSGKGIVGDRHFQEKNNPKSQLTLIESENIDYYNNKFKVQIPYVNFRRNIITKNIKLNNLVGKEFVIGAVKVRANDLCRPCKHLQELLKQKDIIKEFLQKGGLRCEILTSGTIKIGDKIKI
tara:strand:- start:158 stop:595 length:438 start_codon:yes stop_codon:yes gene_type:complete